MMSPAQIATDLGSSRLTGRGKNLRIPRQDRPLRPSFNIRWGEHFNQRSVPNRTIVPIT
jgi:hypothetical protein